MALILCIETATPVCSVGLVDNHTVLECIKTTEEKSHASQISVFIREVLQRNGLSAKQLDAVAVSMGPGSYTGLRIGVSVAKGICFAADVPLIAIDTLKALSYNVLENVNSEQISMDHAKVWLCPMIDARRMEVYTMLLDSQYNQMKEISASIIDSTSYSEILEQRPVVFFGTGSGKCKNIIRHQNAIFLDNVDASASKLAHFAHQQFKNQDFVDIAYFEPFYLKEFQTTTPKNKIFK